MNIVQKIDSRTVLIHPEKRTCVNQLINTFRQGTLYRKLLSKHAGSGRFLFSNSHVIQHNLSHLYNNDMGGWVPHQYQGRYDREIITCRNRGGYEYVRAEYMSD